MRRSADSDQKKTHDKDSVDDDESGIRRSSPYGRTIVSEEMKEDPQDNGCV